MTYLLGPIIVKRIKRIRVPQIRETLAWKNLVVLSPTGSILPSLVNSRVSVHQFQAHYRLGQDADSPHCSLITFFAPAPYY